MRPSHILHNYEIPQVLYFQHGGRPLSKILKNNNLNPHALHRTKFCEYRSHRFKDIAIFTFSREM